jgi:hypothetical protein
MTWNEMKDLWRHVTRRVQSTWMSSALRNRSEKRIGGVVTELRVETDEPKHEKVDNIS